MVAKPRVLLSTSNTEAGLAGKKLHDFLLRCGCDVIVASQAELSGVNALENLDREIRTCDAIVNLVGSHAEAIVDLPVVQSYLQNFDTPDVFLRVDSKLRDSLADFSGLSVNQWESMVALQHGVRRFVYKSVGGNESQPPEDPFARNPRLDRLVGIANQYEDASSLIEKVVADLEGFLPSIRSADQQTVTFRTRPNNLPFAALGDLFQGRDSLLQQLSQHASGNCKPIAMLGVGGVGKTRAAVEFALRHADSYTALLFLAAPSREMLNTGFANLVHVLPIDGMQEADDGVRTNAVQDWLHANPDWLLILDGADTEAAMASVTDQISQLSSGQVLITSRKTGWGEAVDEVLVKPLDAKAAAQYLVRATDQREATRGDAVQAKHAAELVGGLPLCLELAAGYINQLQIRFVQFVMQWEIHQAPILKDFDLSQVDYPHEILVAWKLSADQLDEQARPLLEMLAWFASTPIHQRVFEQLPVVCFAGDAKDALMTLNRLGLVDFQTVGHETVYRLHDLVQATTRNFLTKNPVKGEIALASLEDALSWIDAVFQGDVQDARLWPGIGIQPGPCAFDLRRGLSCLPKPRWNMPPQD